jgi:TonB family protein
MSHRWLIAVSMGAHLAVAGGLSVASVWQIERLDGHRRFRDGIGVLPPPPAPSGGLVAAKAPPIKPKDKPKDKKHPPPVTVQPTTTTTPVTTEATVSENPGPGPGPGTQDDTGTCKDNCAPSHADPVCGDGSLDAGEQCDDGNIASGDGCSSTCQIEVKPRPPIKQLEPKVMSALRISGETQVHPSSSTQSLMVHDGTGRVTGTVKLCISASGTVTSTRLLVPTKYDDYDAALLAAVQDWRYQPYTVAGVPVPACSSVSFIYTIK